LVDKFIYLTWEFLMNSKIFNHIVRKLHETWHLPKYAEIRNTISGDTMLDTLPWTPAKKQKFKTVLEETFGVSIEVVGTVEELVNRTDDRYLAWFFGEAWKPRTDMYHWTGWRIVEEINKTNPSKVLDVGCGYNPFKERIPNLVGIDPYNNCADFMVDILDYTVETESFDHVIALGSINFNSRSDIEVRFKKTIDLLKPGGKLWMRANPGLDHDGVKTPNKGPWVEIFPWSFDVAYELAKKYNLTLETLKQDQDRLFFLFKRNA
jgi:SAM-dependent methyltransferase